MQSGYFSALVPLVSDLRQTAHGHAGGLLFVEPYGTWYGEGFAQAGMGLGVRHLIGPAQDSPAWLKDGILLGFNTFVDMAETPHDMRFWQLALGAEVGTRWFELRGRYTIPVGDTYTHSSFAAGRSLERKRISGQSLSVETLRTAYLETKIESLGGWNLEATAKLPVPEKLGDMRLVAGYASFFSDTNSQADLQTWSAGLEWRPVPALVGSVTWFEDERVTGSDWMFGVGLELPLEVFTGNEKKQSFWTRLKNAFKPQERSMLSRMAGSARTHALPVQLAVTPRVEWVHAARIARTDVNVPEKLTFIGDFGFFVLYEYEPGFSAKNWPVALELYDSYIAFPADHTPLSIGAFYHYRPQSAARLFEQIPFTDQSLKAALNHEGPGPIVKEDDHSLYLGQGIHSGSWFGASGPISSSEVPLAFRYESFGSFANFVWEIELAIFRSATGIARRDATSYEQGEFSSAESTRTLGQTGTGSSSGSFSGTFGSFTEMGVFPTGGVLSGINTDPNNPPLPPPTTP